MGTGLRAGETQHAIAVVREVGRMGAQGTAGGGQTLTIGRPTLEAGIGAAAAAAGAYLRPQFGDGELGEQAIHAAHRTEIAAPEPLLKPQGADDSPRCDQQQ